MCYYVLCQLCAVFMSNSYVFCLTSFHIIRFKKLRIEKKSINLSRPSRHYLFGWTVLLAIVHGYIESRIPKMCEVDLVVLKCKYLMIGEHF